MLVVLCKIGWHLQYLGRNLSLLFKLRQIWLVDFHHILKPKCAKFYFGWGSALNLPKELTVSPIPWLDLMGPTNKAREIRAMKEK